MKIKTTLISLLLIVCASANAQSISDILGGLTGNNSNATTSTLGNLIEGIFTKTNLSISDLVGEYQSTGPAVTFKSDNFLQKAGGLAGAAALETKLKPYYEQYGLTGMPFTVDANGNFTLSIKGIKIAGVITQGKEQGTFIFNMKLMNAINIGKFTAYVQKSGRNLDLMFDATQLKNLISKVAKYSGMSMVKTLASLLDSYDGACIGFKMSYTGSATNSNGTSSPSDSTSTSSSVGSLLNVLGIGNGANNSAPSNANQKQAADTVSSPAQTGLGGLLNILQNSKKK